MDKYFHSYHRGKCKPLKHVGFWSFKVSIPIKLSQFMPCQRSLQRKRHQSSECTVLLDKEQRTQDTSVRGQCTWETASKTRTVVTAEARNPAGESLWRCPRKPTLPALWRAVSVSLKGVMSQTKFTAEEVFRTRTSDLFKVLVSSKK